ncbi:MAG: MFS transporter [Paludibacteraceae bacterium]|nr:MFS transporter [Paludibacteraceae bacterium]MEE1253699.1 MFS transporter [Paludibacteraceae bacterium]
MSTQKKLMTNWRWWMCLLLFIATTVNYMDRQVLSLTWKDFIAPEFHWTDSDYGTITALFSIIYAVCMLFAGRFIDWMGTKKGYLWAIGVWSAGACLHAACGWATMHIEGFESIAAMTAVETGSAVALAIASTSVYLFIAARAILALGEAGNFPAAIKVTAEYFPKKDRAFATSLFNAGASVGALAAPATIPLLAQYFKDLGIGGGWEMAFIIIGALGFIWMGFFVFMYEKPEQSKHVNEAELAYINQDEEDVQVEKAQTTKEEATIPFWKCFTYRQTWSFIAGKFFTDGVWWFYLFWAPAYFSDQYGYSSSSSMGIALIFTLYAIVTVLSIFGGYLPKLFVEKKGMNPYNGRMLAMLLFAFLPLPALFAQGLGVHSVWWPCIIIGLAGAGHQAWSANLFSTIGDMFPKSAIATITGIGGMAGGIGSFLINKGAGVLFTYSEGMGSAFQFLGFEGKQAGYMIIFCICAVAYVLAWSIMKALVPKHKPIVLD